MLLNQLFRLRCKINCDVLSLAWTKILHFKEHPLNLYIGTPGAVTTNTVYVVCYRAGMGDQDLH